MMKNYFFVLLFCTSLTLVSQETYNGNGNSGFGGVIGTGTLVIDDDGTTITLEVTRGNGDFNDAMVIYLDTAPGGRSSIDGDINDQADALRRAISSAGDNASVLTFPSGFDADFAIAVDAGFGGLWSIPASGTIGDGALPFQTSVNSTMTASTDTSFTMDVDWSELGLSSSDSIDFIAVYLNAGNGFTSDESFGSSIAGGNVGGNDLTLTGFFTYANTLNLDNTSLTEVKILSKNKQIQVLGINDNVNIAIFNLLGQSVFQKNNFTISNNDVINGDDLKSGIYLLRIGHNGESKTYKILLD